MLLIFLVFLFLLSPSPILSVPQITVSITNLPQTTILGDTFPVEFSVINSNVGATFYYKVFGGVGSENNSIKTIYNSKELSYTGVGWNEFPMLTVGDSGQFSGSVIAKAVAGTGIYNINIRIHSGDNFESTPGSTITVNSPSPTNTPTATNTPTPTLTPTITPTPTPTHTPTPTSTPKPTTTPTIKPTPTLIVKSSATPTEDPTDLPTIIETEDAALYLITPSPSPTDSEVLGIQDFVASPATVSTKTKLPKNLIPSVFIGTGTALLLTPLILSKLKHGQN